MILDGKKVAEEIKTELKAEVLELKNKGIEPALAVVLVGFDPASLVYVGNKKKACEEIGISSQTYEMPENVSQKELLDLIVTLNQDKKVNGILVQLPLSAHIDESKIVEAISSEKDVDCFHPENFGRAMLGSGNFYPCTPAGIIELLKRNEIELAGKNCLVIGRSNIVGKPLAIMLISENATVTIAHSKTENLKETCSRADIVISAVGKPNFITADMINPGAVVVDVGINRNENGKICGDVDFENVKEKASAITPVPGGVGPMTIAMLMRNTIAACKIQHKL
jgi:methylenetetrahydrofolate dehydrogenase (NADP+)/methenyltetrahydrofolate cyclohydrolase